MCWSGTMSSVFLNQVMVYSGEPSTVQVKNRVLLMPVFRFFGDKVTRSGSENKGSILFIRNQMRKKHPSHFESKTYLLSTEWIEMSNSSVIKGIVDGS